MIRQHLVVLSCITIGLFLMMSPRFIQLPNEVIVSLVLGSLIMVLTSIYYDRKEEPIFMKNPNEYPRTCLDCQKYGKVWGCVQCGKLFREDNQEYLERVRIANLERQMVK